jgi:hypothetical protein
MLKSLHRALTPLATLLIMLGLAGPWTLVQANAAAVVQADEPTDPPSDEPMDEPMDDEEPMDEDEPMDDGDAEADAPESAIEPLDPNEGAAQARLLDLTLHYVLIGKPDLALSNIQALYDTGITDAQIALLVDEHGLREKLERSLPRGRNMQGVAEEFAGLEIRWIAGQRAVARDPGRIAAAIASLGGSMRQQMMARGQLMAAGEYAVPALLRAVIDGKSPQVASAARSMLVEMKRLAVVPLGTALPALDAAGQRKVCEVLSEIGWPTAEPFLLRLANSASAPADVREAAMRAYRRLGGTSNDVGSQFAALARRYFERTPTLIPYPNDPTNNIWAYETYAGLTPITVPTAIYADLMGMMLAREALRADPSSRLALSTYVACDLRRSITEASEGFGEEFEGGEEMDGDEFEDGEEMDGDVELTYGSDEGMEDGEAGDADMDDGDDDDGFGDDAEFSGEGIAESARKMVGLAPYSAEFFATAAGPAILQDVIAMALDAQDTALARAAMAALARTSSTRGMVAQGGRNALVEALGYPDRRVRFDAALVLANALPQQAFASDAAVVPILGSMVAAGGSTGAAIAQNDEDLRTIDARLVGIGFRPLRGGRDFSALSTELVGGQGVDLIVVQGPRGFVRDTIAAIRNSRVAGAAPVVVLADPADASGLSIDFDGDARVAVMSAGSADAQFGRAVAASSGGAGGSVVSEEEGEDYTLRALGALEMIADSGSPVFDVRNAEIPLLGALATASGEMRLRVADVVARVPTERSQRTLMDTALAAQGDEQAELLLRLAESARRFGNMLEPQQVDALRKVITSASGPEADAAGTAYGALGLPVRDVVRLIVTE